MNKHKIIPFKQASITFSKISLSFIDFWIEKLNSVGLCLGVHGGSFDKILSSKKFDSSAITDLDFLVAERAQADLLLGLDSIKTLFECFPTILFKSLTTPDSFHYGYQAKGQFENNTPFSITVYIAPPPTPIFDDVANSRIVWLPDYQVTSKYKDLGLANFLAENQLIFCPYYLEISNQFTRTLLRESQGRKPLGLWMDNRIFDSGRHYLENPIQLIFDINKLFQTHFKPEDPTAYLKLIFFAYTRLLRFEPNNHSLPTLWNYMRQQVQAVTGNSHTQITDLARHLKKMGILASPYTHLYLGQEHFSHILTLCKAWKSCDTPQGKHDIATELHFSVNQALPLKYPIVFLDSESAADYVLRAWKTCRKVPGRFFSIVVQHLLESLPSQTKYTFTADCIYSGKIKPEMAETYLANSKNLRLTYAQICADKALNSHNKTAFEKTIACANRYPDIQALPDVLTVLTHKKINDLLTMDMTEPGSWKQAQTTLNIIEKHLITLSVIPSDLTETLVDFLVQNIHRKIKPDSFYTLWHLLVPQASQSQRLEQSFSTLMDHYAKPDQFETTVAPQLVTWGIRYGKTTPRTPLLRGLHALLTSSDYPQTQQGLITHKEARLYIQASFSDTGWLQSEVVATLLELIPVFYAKTPKSMSALYQTLAQRPLEDPEKEAVLKAWASVGTPLVSDVFLTQVASLQTPSSELVLQAWQIGKTIQPPAAHTKEILSITDSVLTTYPGLWLEAFYLALTLNNSTFTQKVLIHRNGYKGPLPSSIQVLEFLKTGSLTTESVRSFCKTAIQEYMQNSSSQSHPFVQGLSQQFPQEKEVYIDTFLKSALAVSSISEEMFINIVSYINESPNRLEKLSSPAIQNYLLAVISYSSLDLPQCLNQVAAHKVHWPTLLQLAKTLPVTRNTLMQLENQDFKVHVAQQLAPQLSTQRPLIEWLPLFEQTIQMPGLSKKFNAYFNQLYQKEPNQPNPFTPFPQLYQAWEAFKAKQIEAQKAHLEAKQLEALKQHIQSQFNQLSTAFHDYYTSSDEAALFPYADAKEILRSYLAIESPEHTNLLINHPFIWNPLNLSKEKACGKEFIQSILFFAQDSDLLNGFIEKSRLTIPQILEKNNTLISFVIESNNHRFLESLLQHGLNPNTTFIPKDSSYSRSIFQHAVYKRAQDCLLTLLQSPQLQIDSESYKYSPLTQMIFLLQTEALRMSVTHTSLSKEDPQKNKRSEDILNLAGYYLSPTMNPTTLDEIFSGIDLLAEAGLINLTIITSQWHESLPDLRLKPSIL